MKNTNARSNACGRNPELGAIAIVVAALWMTLFGLAAFAVDIGYGYTNKRALKAVADAAVRAGMRSYSTSDQSTSAQAAATLAAERIAGANGHTSGVSVSYPPNRLQVDIAMAQPTFFLRLFGFATTPVAARSAGEIRPGGGAAVLLALGGCGSQGLKLSGNAASTFNGNVWSNGPLDFDNGPMPTTVNGSVQSACAGYPRIFGGAPVTSSPIGTNVVTGAVGTVGTPFTNPLSSVTAASFACNFGDLVNPFSPAAAAGGGPAGEDLIGPGVYCSGGDMNIADVGTKRIFAAGASFVAMGTIQVGADNGATFTPAQNGVVFYSGSNTGCAVGQAINVGFNNFNITGAIYAPNGCVRIGGGSMNVTNGAVVAKEISMGPEPGPKPGWTMGAGGGGAPSWRMYE